MPHIVYANSSDIEGFHPSEATTQQPLLDLGIKSSAENWDDKSVDWTSYDAVVIRSCWDYHTRPDDFFSWIDHLQVNSITIWNPPSILKWNSNKVYLRELAEQGVTIAPTVWVTQGENVDLDSLLAEQGWDEVVAKPMVSATAYNTWRFTQAEAKSQQAEFERVIQHGDMMIQQFVPEVVDKGEWSLMFFGKQYSHSILKQAKAGDFRVQDEWGGTIHPQEPSSTLIEQAEAILSQIESPLLYARVDGVARDTDEFVLMELELIEPHLYLDVDTVAPQRFAEAIAKVLP